MKFPNVTRITPERAQIVIQEISDASEPGLRFYILVIVSTMIAGFGLTMNSTAVIIGAMLVAPLMTPIFGMALALIRGDAHLLGRARRRRDCFVLVSPPVRSEHRTEKDGGMGGTASGSPSRSTPSHLSPRSSSVRAPASKERTT